MPYGRYRRYRRASFRRTRGRYAYRPTSARPKKVSWWKRRRARAALKWLNPNTSKSLLVKLAFADTYTLDCGATALATRDFRLNSLYDPDATGIGGSPSAMTQYAQLYRSYKVVAAKVNLQIWNTGSIPALFGFSGQNDEYTFPSTGRGLQQLFMEMKSGRYTLLNPSTYGDRVSANMTYFTRMRPLLGERYGPDACATIGGNPSKVAHLYVACIAPDGSAVGAKVAVIVRIQFYVKFFNQNSSIIVD